MADSKDKLLGAIRDFAEEYGTQERFANVVAGLKRTAGELVVDSPGHEAAKGEQPAPKGETVSDAFAKAAPPRANEKEAIARLREAHKAAPEPAGDKPAEVAA